MLTAPTSRRAFSLLELLTVVAVVAIVLSLAAPQVSKAIQRERSRAARDSIPARLELILKEGRNRLVPVEFDVDADGIYYQFNPNTSIAFAFDSCEGSAGSTSACRLRNPTPCAVLVDPTRTPTCLRISTTIDGLLRIGDLDGAIALWPFHKRGGRAVETLSDGFPSPVQRLSDPLITFDNDFADFPPGQSALFVVTPLGAVMHNVTSSTSLTQRRIRYTDKEGVATVIEVLDSGVVRVIR